MNSNHLPKIAVALLVLGVALIFFSGQTGQVAATSTTQAVCYYDGYYYNTSYYWYYYYYPYYYCNGYYGYYYGYPYYYDYYYGYYYSPPAKYQLTVATDPANVASVSGNGTYDDGTVASFSVSQSAIQTSQNTRYVFSHWSGDYSGVGSSGSITMNGVRKVVAVYQLQYYLSVSMQPVSAPLPQGEGWYNAGDTVTLTIAGSMLGGQDGSRLLFQGWNVDGKTVQAGVSLTVKMDSPHVVSGQYKTQYYLKVLTDQGVAYGEGWYDAGTSAQIYVSTPVSTNYGVSIVFNGWQGDIQSNSQSATLVVDKPKTVIASWRTDATVLNLTIALGVIAAFLVGAGILAYVALNRNRFRGHTLKSVPPKEEYAAESATSAPVGKKSVPLKKKQVPDKEMDDSNT